MLKPPKDWSARVAREGRFYREAPKKPLQFPIAYRPTIVCLSGSSRFQKEFDQANLRETIKGKIVLTICPGLTDRKKAAKIHRKKIDLADEILVINRGGYIGPSTRSEIAYARKKGKAVGYWESEA